MTTLERILDTIEVISTEADYIYEAIKNIDNSVPAKASAFADVVTARENTNQRMVDFCERLLDALDWEDFDEDACECEEDENF